MIVLIIHHLATAETGAALFENAGRGQRLTLTLLASSVAGHFPGDSRWSVTLLFVCSYSPAGQQQSIQKKNSD